MRVVPSQTVTSGGMKCSLRYDVGYLLLCLLCIDGVFCCRTYNSHGRSARLSNSRRVLVHREATLGLRLTVAMHSLMMIRRRTICTRSGTLSSGWIDTPLWACGCTFLCLLKNDRFLFLSCSIRSVQILYKKNSRCVKLDRGMSGFLCQMRTELPVSVSNAIWFALPDQCFLPTLQCLLLPSPSGSNAHTDLVWVYSKFHPRPCAPQPRNAYRRLLVHEAVSFAHFRPQIRII